MADNGNSGEGEHVCGKEQASLHGGRPSAVSTARPQQSEGDRAWKDNENRLEDVLDMLQHPVNVPALHPADVVTTDRQEEQPQYQPTPQDVNASRSSIPRAREHTLMSYPGELNEETGAATSSVSSGLPTPQLTILLLIDDVRVFATFAVAAILRGTAEAKIAVEHTNEYKELLSHCAFIASKLCDAVRDKDMERIKKCSEALNLFLPLDPPASYSAACRSDAYINSFLPQLLSSIPGWNAFVKEVEGREGMVDLQKPLKRFASDPWILRELVVDKLSMQSLAEREKDLDLHIAKYFTLDNEENHTPPRPSAPIFGSSQHVRRRNSM